MQSNRRDDIKEMVDHYLEVLLRLYDKTDPKYGEDSEYGKLYRAHKAYEIWWYLHDKLMFWAQAHILGLNMVRDDSELLDSYENLTGVKLHEDSHDLEFLGSHYSYNPPNEEHDLYKKTWELLENSNFGATDITIRDLLANIIVSRSADSSFWRFRLQNALKALNDGEVISPLAPEPVKRQGQHTL
jgi:hypothetical protein